VSYHLSDELLLAECRVDTKRAGGPGGQHVNRTASAVRLVHEETGVTVQCQDHRERLRNQRDALRAMRLALALVVRGISQMTWMDPYRSGRQMRAGAQAQEYHLLVGCAVDALERCQGRLAEAAADVSLSSSQLVKLLTADKSVHAAINALRLRHGHDVIKSR